MKNAYQQIKNFVRTHQNSAVLISRTDSFLGEYYPPEAKRLSAVSGFTGSAGLAFIDSVQDVLFVDSRYTVQAKKQSSFQVFEVPTQTTPLLWITENFKGKTVYFNPQTHSVSWVQKSAERLQKAKISLKPLSLKQLTQFFAKQTFRQKNIFDYSVQFCGESSENKLARLGKHIRQNKWDAYLVSTPENVSWLLNKRARTVLEYPVLFERGFVDKQGVYRPLNKQTVSLLKGKKVALFEPATPYFLYQALKKIAVLENAPDIVNYWKAVKNKTEIQNIRLACLYESAVICRFLAWVEENKQSADECACDEKLIALRKENPLYFGDSFETIAAVGAHAALAHYRADKASTVTLMSAPLLLVDTGGHYLNGTTDMTRTIAVQKPTKLMKKRYTQVLQGHIDLATTLLPKGAKASVLDEKAHAYLRADSVDFLHATGHGIGLMLAVHEMPPTVSPYDTLGLQAGMIFSNEPAFYSETDGFGIRLENMLLAVNGANGLSFENLIFAPFDYRLIDFNALTKQQLLWLKNYHQTIYETVFPMLSLKEQEILLPFITAFQKDEK